MGEMLLTPPSALLINIFLISILYGLGRLLAGPGKATSTKSSTYSSGEAPPTESIAPGYRPFFVVALFFAILHLGVLVLGSESEPVYSVIFLVGLILSLLALILG